ncbi:MAG: SAF domain-containing protein [Acidimicrobiia bacterium]
MAVLLVALSALVAVVLFTRAAARDPVLALAADVERGQVVTAGDFQVVYVGTDDPISTVASDELSSLVGLTAVSDLEAGTIVTPAHFVARSVLEPGEGVVGLALSPGEYPTLRLAAGDLVDVILTESPSAASEAEATDGGVVLAERAEVFDIAELGTQGQRFVSLRLPEDAAADVARAAAQGRVRLVLVAGAER